MSKKKGETETKENPVFSEKISDLENYYADNVLSKDLKSLYDQVQLDNADFRSNVFLKNIDILDSEIVSISLIFRGPWIRRIRILPQKGRVRI